MVIDPQVLALLTGAGGVIATLAGFVYRELKAQIEDRDKRIATLEAAAAEMTKAKDAEIAEWRRIAWNKPSDRP